MSYQRGMRAEADDESVGQTSGELVNESGDTHRKLKNKESKWMVLVSLAGLLAMVLTLLLVVWFVRWHVQPEPPPYNGPPNNQEDLEPEPRSQLGVQQSVWYA